MERNMQMGSQKTASWRLVFRELVLSSHDGWRWCCRSKNMQCVESALFYSKMLALWHEFSFTLRIWRKDMSNWPHPSPYECPRICCHSKVQHKSNTIRCNRAPKISDDRCWLSFKDEIAVKTNLRRPRGFHGRFPKQIRGKTRTIIDDWSLSTIW